MPGPGTVTWFWNYHAGLTLRLFMALRRSPAPAVQTVYQRHRDRIELLEMIIRHQIQRSVSWRGDAIEIRSSTLSGETNSETQPWTALGLMAYACQ